MHSFLALVTILARPQIECKAKRVSFLITRNPTKQLFRHWSPSQFFNFCCICFRLLDLFLFCLLDLRITSFRRDVHRRPHSSRGRSLIKYCTKNGVPPPPDKPQGPPAKPSPPITDADFPALPKPSAAIPRRSPPTGRLTVPVSTAGRPQAHTPPVSKPPPALPKAPATSSASSADVSMEPPPADQPDVHMATADTSEFSFLEMIRAGEATETTIATAPADLMDTSPPQQPYASLDTPIHPSTSTHLRPTIHPPTRPDPDFPMTPETPSQPFLYHLFAEVFRPLPYISNLFKIVPDSGWDISTAPLLSWRMSLIAPQRTFSPCWPQPTSNGLPFTLGRVSFLALSHQTPPLSALSLWPGSTWLMNPLLPRLCLGDSRMSFPPVMNCTPPLSSRAPFALVPPPLYT